MNIFFEFHKLVQELQNKKVKYAVIGSVGNAEDLIWLKSQRNSSVDKADIEQLTENEDKDQT